jgi:hypothetical protein
VIGWLLIASHSRTQCGYSLDDAAWRLALAYREGEPVSLRIIESDREREPTENETRQLANRAALLIEGRDRGE